MPYLAIILAAGIIFYLLMHLGYGTRLEKDIKNDTSGDYEHLIVYNRYFLRI